jgi:hypothetical protein
MLSAKELFGVEAWRFLIVCSFCSRSFVTAVSSVLQKLNWRIDLKTNARDVSEMNDPTAIIEMGLKKKVREVDCVFI